MKRTIDFLQTPDEAIDVCAVGCLVPLLSSDYAFTRWGFIAAATGRKTAASGTNGPQIYAEHMEVAPSKSDRRRDRRKKDYKCAEVMVKNNVTVYCLLRNFYRHKFVILLSDEKGLCSMKTIQSPFLT